MWTSPTDARVQSCKRRSNEKPSLKDLIKCFSGSFPPNVWFSQSAAAEGGWATPTRLSRPDSTTPDIPRYRTVLLADGEHRARVISLADLEGRMFQVGRSLRTYDSIISSYRNIGGAGLALTIVMGSARSYVLLRQTVLRVEKVRCAAVAIGKTDLARRVETRSGGDEIDALARAFNAMLDRIAMLVDELKILSSNIAHDLRGPIARIRGTAELAATGKPDIGELQESAGIVVEECDRLDSVIGTMLEIARTEAGIVRYKRERIDIKQLLSEAVQLFSPLAEDKTIGLSLALPEQDVLFWGDRSALQRVVANLLDNALKYTSADGKVAVRCEVVESGIRIRVADTGVGIALPDLPHIFDRFFRQSGWPITSQFVVRGGPRDAANRCPIQRQQRAHPHICFSRIELSGHCRLRVSWPLRRSRAIPP